MNEIFKRGLLCKFTIFPETLKGSKTGMRNRCVNIRYKQTKCQVITELKITIKYKLNLTREGDASQ